MVFVEAVTSSPDASAIVDNEVVENSTVEFAVLLRLPGMVAMAAPVTEAAEVVIGKVAEVNTGKFCRLLAPVSVSCGSFGVIPKGARSIPSSLRWSK